MNIRHSDLISATVTHSAGRRSVMVREREDGYSYAITFRDGPAAHTFTADDDDFDALNAAVAAVRLRRSEEILPDEDEDGEPDPNDEDEDEDTWEEPGGVAAPIRFGPDGLVNAAHAAVDPADFIELQEVS